MQALRQAGVELIVAPYEADAQLAFLSRTGAVDVVLSEDSDCLPYGCKKVMSMVGVCYTSTLVGMGIFTRLWTRLTRLLVSLGALHACFSVPKCALSCRLQGD